MSETAVLRIEDLDVRFATAEGELHCVRNLSLIVERGECLGIVGESGAGKSQAFLAVMGLLAANGRASGHARFESEELIGASQARLDRIRGARLAMILQNPMSALTPHLRVGDQIAELLVRHRAVSWRDARARALAAADASAATGA